jgi:tetratricopeptide (TPR) repeat protein
MKKTLGALFLLIVFLVVFDEVFNSHSHVKTPIEECWTFNDDKDYERAIESGKLAIEKYPNNSDAYRCLGTAYYNAGELNLAYENMKKVESLTNDKRSLIDVDKQIGEILHKMGRLDDAVSYYDKALKVIEDLEIKSLNDKDPNDIVNRFYEDLMEGDRIKILNNIALIYEEKGQLDKALNYYRESLNSTVDKEEKATIYKYIARIYDKKGDRQKAVEYMRKAIELNKKAEENEDNSDN